MLTPIEYQLLREKPRTLGGALAMAGHFEKLAYAFQQSTMADASKLIDRLHPDDMVRLARILGIEPLPGLPPADLKHNLLATRVVA